MGTYRLPTVEDYGEKKNDEDIEEIIQRTYGMALLHGVQWAIQSPENPENVIPMPFTLFPSILPRTVLEQALSIQTHFQKLIYDISNDYYFMKHCLQKILEVDEFTRRLWEIYETVRSEGSAQDVSLVLVRNDFMIEREENTKEHSIKQVELNTFASGAGGVITGMRDVHRYSLTLAGIPFDDDQLPENTPTRGLAEGIATAWETYNNVKAAVLFIVGTPEPNTPDQRWLERDIFKINRTIKVVYRTFHQIQKTLTLGPDRQLFVDGTEISVVYFRYGYTPNHYPTEKDYDMRLQIERSKAIKCPSVVLHLAGCKKIQQELSQEGVLERYIRDQRVVELLRSTFVQQTSLDKIASKQDLIQRARDYPDKFVLKPQREGGGNNLFGDDVKQFMSTVSTTSEKSDWILMEKINALRHKNRLIRKGIKSDLRTVVSELGVFGAYLGKPGKEICNIESGFLIRTKPESVNEAGLFNGLSCLDSPFLI